MILKSYTDSVIGKKVKESLIPAIVHLRKVYPLSLDLFFTPSFVASAGEGVKLDSTDLEASDQFFDSFGYE